MSTRRLVIFVVFCALVCTSIARKGSFEDDDHEEALSLGRPGIGDSGGRSTSNPVRLLGASAAGSVAAAAETAGSAAAAAASGIING